MCIKPLDAVEVDHADDDYHEQPYYGSGCMPMHEPTHAENINRQQFLDDEGMGEWGPYAMHRLHAQTPEESTGPGWMRPEDDDTFDPTPYCFHPENLAHDSIMSSAES